MNYLWPIILVITANTFYNICQKSTPQGAQPLVSLFVTYMTAGIVTLLLFFSTSKSKHLIPEIKKLNWTSIVLGLAIVGLEFGFIYLYRVGWKISVGSLVANVGLAVVLLFVGAILYKEHISVRQIAGIIISISGIILMSK